MSFVYYDGTKPQYGPRLWPINYLLGNITWIKNRMGDNRIIYLSKESNIHGELLYPVDLEARVMTEEFQRHVRALLDAKKMLFKPSGLEITTENATVEIEYDEETYEYKNSLIEIISTYYVFEQKRDDLLIIKGLKPYELDWLVVGKWSRNPYSVGATEEFKALCQTISGYKSQKLSRPIYDNRLQKDVDFCPYFRDCISIPDIITNHPIFLQILKLYPCLLPISYVRKNIHYVRWRDCNYLGLDLEFARVFEHFIKWSLVIYKNTFKRLYLNSDWELIKIIMRHASPKRILSRKDYYQIRTQDKFGRRRYDDREMYPFLANESDSDSDDN